jgi:hypothetical protein
MYFNLAETLHLLQTRANIAKSILSLLSFLRKAVEGKINKNNEKGI